MRFDVVTLFPEMLQAISASGVTSRAIEQGLFQLHHWNPRDYTHDRHRTVDDRPYGGGPGMVMIVEPLQAAIHHAREAFSEHSSSSLTVCLSPQGRALTQGVVEELSSYSQLILVAGRYEGIDERLLDLEVDQEISLGDYILSGGELGAMVLIDSISRLIPGVLGHHESAQQDSFSDVLLDCPHYTRPVEYQGLKVPEILRSGDHVKIKAWRREQALGRTHDRRPDLLSRADIDEKDQRLLDHYQKEKLTQK